MISEGHFLGEPLSFWAELKKTADAENTVELIRENARLRALVSFYEDKIDQMVRFRSVNCRGDK